MKIARLVVNPFEENTYLLIDEATLETAVVDPGMVTEDENRRFADYVERNKLKITQVLFTHGHLDHCFGANWVHKTYGATVKGAPEDIPLLQSLPAQAARFGMRKTTDDVVEIEVPLRDNDIIDIGDSKLQVIAVPGHSLGGLSFYNAKDGFVVTGDSLFDGAIGRTDLPGGNYATLVDAVTKRLLALPDATVVYPGHGPSTTIGKEKAYNPYL